MADPDVSRTSVAAQRSFYAALGDFIVHWAFMELALDHLLTLVSIVRDPLREQLPYQLRDKLKYVRRIAREFAEISLAAPDLLSTLDVIEQLSEWRHAVIHGAALSTVQMEGRDDLSVVLMRFLNPSKQNTQSVTVTTAKINRTARELDAIIDRLFDMAEAMPALHRPDPHADADPQVDALFQEMKRQIAEKDRA